MNKVHHHHHHHHPIQDYVHPDDQTQPTFEITPGFKTSQFYCENRKMVRNASKQQTTSRAISAWVVCKEIIN